MSQSLPHVAVWDGWRGLAITLVLFGHFVGIDFMFEDRMGVDVFFALSGLLIGKILFEKRMNLRRFYWRRLTRVFPAFIIFVCVLYTVGYISGWKFSAVEFLSTLSFLRTYVPATPHIWDAELPLGHLWSLNVEEHAYLLMSVITLFLKRARYAATLLIAIGLCSILISLNYLVTSPEGFDGLRIRTECVLAFLFFSAGYGLIKSESSIRVAPWAPVVSLVVAAACYVDFGSPIPHIVLSPILLAFTINHLTESHRILITIFSHRWLRMLGLWSYSIYLWQQPFYEFSWYLPLGHATGLLLSVIAGICSYYLLENPIRSKLNAWFDLRNTAGSVSR